MDPRQPSQHPFSRNTTSPYGRTPFPPASNPPPFSPASQPQHGGPPYPEHAHQQHQRKPSDPLPYYSHGRAYGGDGAPIQGGHSRTQSTSSITHGTPGPRGMPPPSSPQQQGLHHNYGPPRGAPLGGGPPISFASGRELPALTSLPTVGRPTSTGSSMSISSMLGGPPPVPREAGASAPPNGAFGPAQGSPPMNPGEYAPSRRPQTPEHQRTYGPRDNRANSAGSPSGVPQFPTPEVRHFGTPQGYDQRGPQGPAGPPAEERRDQPMRVQNTAIPPRPNSQPSGYNQQRALDPSRAPIHDDGFGRRGGDPRIGEPVRSEVYPRPSAYDDRHATYAYDRERLERERLERERQDRERLERERHERERKEKEATMQREREQRDRDHTAGAMPGYAHQMMPRRQSMYGHNEPEQAAWMRPNYEQPRPGFEQQVERPPPPPQQQAPGGYEYPNTTTASPYGNHPTYAPESQYAHNAHAPSHPGGPGILPYDASIQERQRMAQQQVHPQAGYAAPGPIYQSHESPGRRPLEESQQMQQQRSFLGVQEINRKGRLSPLPQAVQGVQGQLGGPGGEPGIKSEFGRMFSGIGSGVGGLGMPSPGGAGSQGIPFSGTGSLRRDDLEGLSMGESPLDAAGQKLSRTSSRGGRRRKLKEDESKGDDESSSGRLTPSGRGKRAKSHHHHHHNHHHHHHHRPDALDQNSSPNHPLQPSQSNITPFKPIKGSSTVPSPPGPDGSSALHHHHVPRHHHHHVTPTRPIIPINPIIPLTRKVVHSQSVLDAVSHLPRHHLGHDYYNADLRPVNHHYHAQRGFASTPRPLPRFENNENCTFTVKVARVHLSPVSREEITSRKAVWGTDVYTDDSDVIAACIHQGWFRGQWPEDVDVNLLGLDLDDATDGAENRDADTKNTDGFILKPPFKGPMEVPEERDLHVKVLILPKLEKYSSCVRFGMKSREWGKLHVKARSRGLAPEDAAWTAAHDGLSYMIMGIKWVDGVDGGPAEKGGAGRRKLMARELDANELEAERAWGGKIFNNTRNQKDEVIPGVVVRESFERGTLPVDEEEDKDGQASALAGNGDIKGIGMGSWWKPSKARGEEKQSAGDSSTQDPSASHKGEIGPAPPKAAEVEKGAEVAESNEREVQLVGEKEIKQEAAGDEIVTVA